jgi:phosphoglycerate dehydrogenase-like enzyme
MTDRKPRVAVVPSDAMIEAAVERGGAVLSEPGSADAMVWMDPRDPEALRSTLDGSPAKWIQLPFAGIEEFRDAGVLDAARTWTCAKGTYGATTAEHALALVLMAARLIHRHARRTSWMRRSEFDAARRLAGGTVLIVGTGGIGTALAEMLAPLRPRILAANRSGDPAPWAERTVASSELADLVGEADWVVLAAALTPETERLFDAEMIGRMREGAWIINVGRGRLVDTDALVEALNGHLGGAALDVTDPEPLPEGHPLWGMDNVVITSHAANTWQMAIPELAERVARNVERFARGEELEGLVDVSLGY